MNTPTYRLGEETKTVNGRNLHRVVALVDNRFASAGDRGGWVESENNLAHDGSWVGDEAQVYGDGRVECGAAALACSVVCDQSVVTGRSLLWESCQIRGQARVEGGGVSPTIVAGEAVVDGAALVSDGAVVAGNAVVSDSGRVGGGARVGGNARVTGLGAVKNFAVIAGSVVVCGTAVLDGMRHRPRFGSDVLKGQIPDEDPNTAEVMEAWSAVRPTRVFVNRVSASA